jgi:hypothetical protein
MAQRGRKSAASLSIVSMAGHERPAPPEDLIEDEAKEWREIAGRMPQDWFTRENFPLLAEYCRHIVRARDLAQDIAKFKRYPSEVRLTTEGIQRYDMLLKMADRERAALVQLATKQRFSQQSRYTEKRAGTAVKPQSAPGPPPASTPLRH